MTLPKKLQKELQLTKKAVKLTKQQYKKQTQDQNEFWKKREIIMRPIKDHERHMFQEILRKLKGKAK